MKKAYFTPETIDRKAEEMLNALVEFNHRQKTEYKPQGSALLVLDLQEYFLVEASHAFIPSAPAILPGINALIQVYAKHDLPVIVTRHINTPTDGGLMAVWWRELISPDHPLSGLDPRLEVQGAITLDKPRYDAFHDSPLEQILTERGVRQVVITGVMTHLCCETTARSAFMRGFEVFFTVDGTATYTEAFQRATLLNLAHGFAVPVRVSEILSRLVESSGG